MSRGGEDQHHHGTYMLTCDLPERVLLFRQIGIKTPEPTDPFYREFHTGLVERLNAALTNATVRVVSMSELASRIIERALAQTRRMQNAEIVSTCVEIAALRRGTTLEVNRIIDINGNILGIGTRPGSTPMRVQLEGIKSHCHDRPLVLVEDGAFTGRTMHDILSLATQLGMRVSSIVLGFAFPEALETIRSIYKGEIITIEDETTYVDWMPDHDFVPFIPNCGRTVGFGTGDAISPYYNADGMPYTVPYLHPYCPMAKWTSLAEKDCVSISTYCKQMARRLFTMLETLNNRELTISDLIGTVPRVAIPVCVGNQRFATIRTDQRVTQFLQI